MGKETIKQIIKQIEQSKTAATAGIDQSHGTDDNHQARSIPVSKARSTSK
jgi:hypothetical protein